ncbi:hypothetical protein PAL_GLEAN10018554 [Pteropus alecto]|uniref:Uncharacterized protein n=1 Tax=Pteropus alecto TaxID=9402 RepID=L5JR41_PTEAL|nr:hypothetical protein PAL_GLEAN10018554 [Pteropus alecto]
MIESLALAGWRRWVLNTLSRRGAGASSPKKSRSRRRHRCGGQSRALLHFRPPVSSQYNPQRSGALKAHPKSSHLRRPEMTSRDPTWPALRPRSSAQLGKKARAALEHAQKERNA